MSASQHIYKQASDSTLELSKLFEQVNQSINDVAILRGDEGFRSMESIVATAWDGLDSITEPPVPTGIEDVDRIIGGFMRGQVVTVAARSGKGKTSFALQCGVNIAGKGHPVGMISLEMGEDELLDRIIGRFSRVNMHFYRNGNRGPNDLTRITGALGRIDALPFYIADRPSPYLSAVMADVRSLHAQHGIRLAIIDYVQLMQVEVKRTINSRAQELGVVTQQLKSLARELGITILLLAQMNRVVESHTRRDKRPRLSDLKDSGSIEQDSDIVIFLHYPGDYKDDQPPDLCEIRVEKHRAGPTGYAPVRAHLAFSEFERIVK
jgi:replicative DNA helicase